MIGEVEGGEKNHVIIYKIGIACKQPCARRHQCGHRCTGHACCDECPSCKEKEIKLLPCGHRQEGECGLVCEREGRGRGEGGEREGRGAGK